MARPRSFDTDETLKVISATFRRNGYSATSLDELSDATGLKRPSLYAAYGDKRNMYLMALSALHDDIARSADRLEAARLPLDEALARWLTGCVDAYVGSRSGCLATGTAAAEAVDDEEIRAALARIIDLLDRRIERWFRIAGFEDAAGRAGMITALMHSLSIRARAGASRQDLTSLWQAALPAILAPLP
jgi:AcrR family transcriptional regulator